MDKEHQAIERLQKASKMSLEKYGEPLIVTDSGGKDSSVCKALAERSGIQFEVMHNHTTADAPETVYFVRSEAKRLENKGIKYTINYPTYKGKPTSMWNLIPQKLMPPTRLVRYCCEVLKEYGGNDRFITTGVRWAESRKRKERGIYEKIASKKGQRIVLQDDNDDTRQLFENCAIKGRRTVNPIVDWKDEDIWDYINVEKIPVNPLYQCGFHRVGCIGCPMAGTQGRYSQFKRYPKYKDAYIRAFDKMVKMREEKGLKNTWGKQGKDVFHWWMEDGTLPGQYELDDFGNIE